MLSLPDVTLIATTSIDIEDTIKAMQICMSKVNFGAAVFVSHEKPVNLPDNIQYAYFPKIENIMDFNHLMWENLHEFFDTSHCLTVQNHAYILDENQWDDEWLDYDWIGSPWKTVENSYLTDSGRRIRVGNGGWSLRSHNICEIPYKNNLVLQQRQGYFNEDGNYCVYYADFFESLGINFAPINIASIFGYETPMIENNFGNNKYFGFHRNKPIGT